MTVEYDLGEDRLGRATMTAFTPGPSKRWSSLTWQMSARRFAPVDGRPAWTFTLPSNPEFRDLAIARIASAAAARR